MDGQRARKIIGELARDQHTVMARWQLLERGISRSTIDSFVEHQRVVVVRRGVYALGHKQLSREGRWMAAVLACGPATVLSHRHAAAHWGLIAEPGGWVHVTRRTRAGRRKRHGIVVHRPQTLCDDEHTEHDGIPVTSVARTILDVAAGLRGRRLEQVVRASARLRRFDLVEQRTVLERHPRHPGARPLHDLLGRLQGRGTEDLRSELELLFLDLCDEHGFPPPVVNGHVEGIRVDFHWPHARLVVETDGFEWHSMPTAFEQDRANDQRLVLAGWRIIRATRRQVRHGELVPAVVALLSDARAR
jgi:hypothetical protein